MKKQVTIVAACYNEEENVEILYKKLTAIFAQLEHYQFELLFIDNASQDATVSILRRLATDDARVKVIVNARNFGHIRSPYHALLQTNADATILIASDLQDPPECIFEFIKKWEEGAKIVVAVKDKSDESKIMFMLRKSFYAFVTKIADVSLIKNFTGFGLYDRHFIQILKSLPEPYPYFRGLISELGYDIVQIPFHQPIRERGKSSNNFYTLYDMAILGITSHSKIPIRLATMAGTFFAFLSLMASFLFLILKLVFWNSFQMGIAPILIGFFFLFSIQLLFIGLLGEYISFIHTRLMNRPLVIERERINFSK